MVISRLIYETSVIAVCRLHQRANRLWCLAVRPFMANNELGWSWYSAQAPKVPSAEYILSKRNYTLMLLSPNGRHKLLYVDVVFLYVEKMKVNSYVEKAWSQTKSFSS